MRDTPWAFTPVYFFVYGAWTSDPLSAPDHPVGMHGISNRDAHLHASHNSSVYLTATTEVRLSGQITDWMRHGCGTPRDCELKLIPGIDNHQPSLLEWEWPCQAELRRWRWNFRLHPAPIFPKFPTTTPDSVSLTRMKLSTNLAISNQWKLWYTARILFQ